jgi:DNA replication protein DnaC
MTNASLQILRQMKLEGMASAYEGVLHLPINQQPDAHELLARLADAEQQHRSDKRMKMYLRLSKMRYQATIQDIDASENRNLTKSQLMLLSDCSYLDRGENILVTGSTGCGKSYLSCALGNNACVHGYRTLYFNMNRFQEQIAIAKTDGTFIKGLDRLKKAKLIVLDDFGLQPISQVVRMALLQILEDRYEKASVIICSQLPVSKWHEYLKEPTIADAILDRITPKSHRIELQGKSLRKGLNQLS